MNAGLGAIAPNANPMAPKPQPFQELLKLDKMVRAANLGVAAQGQQAMSQAQQQQPTVKDQLMMALDQALGASNYGFAGGGIVAFSNGGDTSPTDLEALDADIMADTMFGFGATPEQTAADELRVQAAREAAERERIRAQYDMLKQAGAPQAAELLRQNPWLEPGQPAAPPRGAPTAPRPAPAGAGAPAALPASRPLVALQPLTPPAGADVVPGSAVSPVAGRVDLAELRKTQEALAELAGQRGAVSPAVAAAREELDRLSRTALDPAEQQLRQLEAQQQRSILSDPEALMQMLSGVRGAMTFGEALAGAGAGAAKTRAGRETRVRDARGALAQLRSDLALAQAKERLARVEGDERGAREAQTKQAEIKAQIAATTVDLQFKQEDLEVKRRQVGAQERTARAAEASAGTRAAGAEDRGEAAKRKAISDAIEAAQKAVQIPAGVTGPARQRMIDRQVEMVAQQVAPYGVTRDEVLRYFATPGPASGATTQTQGWGQPQVVPKP